MKHLAFIGRMGQSLLFGLLGCSQVRDMNEKIEQATCSLFGKSSRLIQLHVLVSSDLSVFVRKIASRSFFMAE